MFGNREVTDGWKKVQYVAWQILAECGVVEAECSVAETGGV
jgi:hypothetical protein